MPIALLDSANKAGKYILDRYDPYYNILCHEALWTRISAIADTPVAVRLDNEAPASCCHRASEGQRNQTLVNIPDAVPVIINPASPWAIKEALKARLEHFENIISEGDEVLDGVVILKDIGMSGERMIYPAVAPDEVWPDEGEVVSLNLIPEEREAQEREWCYGAEKGYELARKLGVRATIACSITGEGVKEAVDDLVMKVLEKRKVDEVTKAEEARRQREARLLAAMPWWKRLL